MPGREPRPAVVSAALLAAAGCHEVVELPEPRIEGARSAVLSAREASGSWSHHASSMPLGPAPVWALGPEPAIAAVGYGCSLERLGLGGGPLDPLPTPLPPPLARLRFTFDEGWASATTVPGPLGDAVAAGDGCEAFVSAPSLVTGRVLTAPRADNVLGSPLVDVARLDDGRFFVLQELGRLAATDPPRFERAGARYLIVDPADGEARNLPGSADWPASGFAPRGEQLVLVGPEGASLGHPGAGFTPALDQIPALQGEALVEVAVSPPGEPLEVFTLSRNRVPAVGARTTTVTLTLTDATGSRVIARRPIGFQGNRVELTSVVWTGPGQAVISGFSTVNDQLGFVDGGVLFEFAPSALANRPNGLAADPDLGVVVMTDAAGATFLGPANDPTGGAWRRISFRLGDREPVAVQAVDGRPVVLLSSEDTPDHPAGVRFVVVGEDLACETETLDVRPVRDELFDAGLLAAGRYRSGAWWVFSAFDELFQTFELTLPEDFGACSIPR